LTIDGTTGLSKTVRPGNDRPGIAAAVGRRCRTGVADLPFRIARERASV